jgi:hypothetical protein
MGGTAAFVSRAVRGTIYAIVLAAVASCCGPPLPYSPASLPASLKVSADKWVFLPGANNAESKAEAQIVEQGFELANAVLLSDCFRQGVVGSSMTHTRNRTPAAIYESMTALPAERLRIDFYYKAAGPRPFGTRVVGWDRPSDPDLVHMNRAFVNTPFMVADNLLHEAAHARGYRHKSATEYSSVPYTMNRIFEGCARKAEGASAAPGTLSDTSDE